MYNNIVRLIIQWSFSAIADARCIYIGISHWIWVVKKRGKRLYNMRLIARYSEKVNSYNDRRHVYTRCADRNFCIMRGS